jgi:hypothetical protein
MSDRLFMDTYEFIHQGNRSLWHAERFEDIVLTIWNQKSPTPRHSVWTMRHEHMVTLVADDADPLLFFRKTLDGLHHRSTKVTCSEFGIIETVVSRWPSSRTALRQVV